jgi:hypothetical protein
VRSANTQRLQEAVNEALATNHINMRPLMHEIADAQGVKL